MTGEVQAELARLVRGELRFHEPMAPYTSLRVGGMADCLAVPADADDLRQLAAFLADRRVPYLLLGGGNNLLVRDGGYRGVVISLERLDRLFAAEDGRLLAEAGVENRALAELAWEKGLTGMEFLVGIPGRLGGALAMNAGAGGRAIIDSLTSITTWNDGRLTVKGKGDLDYGYRFLGLSRGEIILGASFLLQTAERGEIRARMDGELAHRRVAQRVGFPSAGSFFRNPPEGPAWRLIEEAGFRGCRIGGAQVSEAHCNFLVNRGGAKAADFLELAERIKAEVRKGTGIDLEEEVRIVGDDR